MELGSRYTDQDRHDIEDYGSIRGDEPMAIDPDTLTLSETPEGQGMERDTLWQAMEDDRAQAVADAEWRVRFSDQRRAA